MVMSQYCSNSTDIPSCACAAGRLPGLAGRFQEVALLGPTDFIGEVVASKHKYTAMTECECNMSWLKPQELHMLGPKSLGLAMQYNEMRGKRWQQQMKEAAVLSSMQQTADPVDPLSDKAASTSKRCAVASEHLMILE